MINRFQNTKLRTKIMIFFLLVALIPLLLFSFVLGRQLLRDQRNSEELHARQIVEQVRLSLDTYIGVLDDTMNSVELALKEEQEGGAADSVENELARLVASQPYIVGAMVAYSDDSFVRSAYVANSYRNNLFVNLLCVLSCIYNKSACRQSTKIYNRLNRTRRRRS